MAAPDPTELGRKLRQHDNEFDAIYELLRIVDGKVDAGFARVDARIDGLAVTVDGLAVTVDGLADGQQQILALLRGLQQGGDTSAG